MKIYDCFTYYNEEKILKIRLEELGDLVEKFIIVEASQTFSGKEKPFYLDDVSNWIDKWKHKIYIYRVDFPDQCTSAWDREYFQRNCLAIPLKDLSSSEDDIIVISDADEIWNIEAIKKIKYQNIPIRLDVKQYFWNFHWRVPDHCNQGARPVVCKPMHLQGHTPQELRSMHLPLIPDGGWHFSFFGEEELVKNKIESFAHTEYNEEKYKSYDSILKRIKNGIDPFDRFPLKYNEIDHTYPKSVFNANKIITI